MRLTHAKLTSRAATKSETTGDTDTAHEDGDQAGLHDDGILILGFLWIAITDQLFRLKVLFLFLFLIQINYLYSIPDFQYFVSI